MLCFFVTISNVRPARCLNYLMLSNVRAQKYSKNGAHTRSILEKFAFDTTLKLILNLLWVKSGHFDGSGPKCHEIKWPYIITKVIGTTISHW